MKYYWANPFKPGHREEVDDYVGYFWQDWETGGLKPSENAACQVACAITGREPEFKLLAYYCSYIRKPEGLTIEKEAIDVHGLTEEFLADKPEETLVAQVIQSMLLAYPGKLRYAGFRCGFDLGFADAVHRRTMIYAPYLIPSFDVYKEAKAKVDGKLLPINPKWNQPSYKLTDILKVLFGIDDNGAHDAGWDIANTIRAARTLYQMPELGIAA